MTRPRHEFAFFAAAREAGLETFWPAQTVTRRYEGAVRTWRRMLFPTYVFARSVDCREGVFSRRAGHVVRVLDVADQETFEAQLAAVRLAVEAGLETELRAQLTAGRLVRIVAGPLRGTLAVVADASGMGAVALRLDVLGQEVVVRVAAGDLEAAA